MTKLGLYDEDDEDDGGGNGNSRKAMISLGKLVRRPRYMGDVFFLNFFDGDDDDDPVVAPAVASFSVGRSVLLP